MPEELRRTIPRNRLFSSYSSDPGGTYLEEPPIRWLIALVTPVFAYYLAGIALWPFALSFGNWALLPTVLAFIISGTAATLVMRRPERSVLSFTVGFAIVSPLFLRWIFFEPACNQFVYDSMSGRYSQVPGMGGVWPNPLLWAIPFGSAGAIGCLLSRKSVAIRVALALALAGIIGSGMKALFCLYPTTMIHPGDAIFLAGFLGAHMSSPVLLYLALRRYHVH